MTDFENSPSDRKNPLRKHFSKSHSKFPKNFHFRESEMLPHAIESMSSAGAEAVVFGPFSERLL